MHVWWASATLKSNGGEPIDWRRFTSGAVALGEANGDHESILFDRNLAEVIGHIVEERRV
jgi:hypothetical protein